jgi:cold-inducible RNA-binding protein
LRRGNDCYVSAAAVPEQSFQEFVAGLGGRAPPSATDTSLPGPPPMASAAPRPSADPACKLFVGQVPLGMEDATLHALFSAYGQVVEAEVVRDRESGLPRGYAFVAMATHEQAATAMAGLDGFVVEGKRLLVALKVSPSSRSWSGAHASLLQGSNSNFKFV